MVNEDILTSLRNAVNSGESLESAKASLVNSGYSYNEVEEASQFVAGSGIIPSLPQTFTVPLPIPQPVQTLAQAKQLQQSQTQKFQPLQTQLPQQTQQTQTLQPIQQIQQLQSQQTQQSTQQQLQQQISQPSKKSYIKEIILVIILLVLLAILGAIIFFKDTILEFFS